MDKPVTNPIDYWRQKYLVEHAKVQELEKKIKEYENTIKRLEL